MMNPREIFGDIDIYLFDQILKERFPVNSKILDAGCGYGRNIFYFLQQRYDVYGIDQNRDAVEHLRKTAQELASDLPPENFAVGKLEEMPFEKDLFDAVISSAVLHFAADEKNFLEIFGEMWRVLKKGGLFFARLASTIGIEDRVKQINGRRFLIPDGSERFLVDQEFLLSITEKSDGTLLDPIKTTNVQNLRSMTTWVVRKNPD